MPLVSFYTTGKHQKIFGYMIFSEGIVRNYWHEMN